MVDLKWKSHSQPSASFAGNPNPFPKQILTPRPATQPPPISPPAHGSLNPSIEAPKCQSPIRPPPQIPRCASSQAATATPILLTAEEATLYQLHVNGFFTDYQPVTQTECELVGRLAITEWRLNRLTRIEMGLYAAGHLQFAGFFADQDPNARDLLIDNHILQTYSRQLKDLSLQESRLRRYFAKDEERYLALQKTRLEQAEERKANAPATVLKHVGAPISTPPAPLRTAAADATPNGFEFSSAPKLVALNGELPLEATRQKQPNPKAA